MRATPISLLLAIDGMGAHNSSVTRVWPVFDCLLGRDPSGVSWLPQLLALGSMAQDADPTILARPGMLLPDVARFERELPGPLRRALGPDLAKLVDRIRLAYEAELPPPEAFLRWALENPARLNWPEESPSRRRKYGESTQSKREDLLAGRSDVRQEALDALGRFGARGSRRKWWAFEGFTSVDCYLETDSLVLLIEGKRDEPVSVATDWFPLRNQVIRNVEVAQAVGAEKSKNFAVLVCAEESPKLIESAWANSLPHFSAEQTIELKSHYLGWIDWATIVRELCPGLRLPANIDEAIALSHSLRT